jgi:predicted DNA-binding transcriptional regulator AlpA
MAAVEARYIAELHPPFNVLLRVVEPEPDQIPIFWANETPERANNVPEPYLRPEEVCEGLGWAIWDLQAAVKGGCPSIRIGARTVRFKWSEVRAWLDEWDKVAPRSRERP